MPEHFDVIIIGTGAGGGTLLNRIAPSGKRILVLERGPFLPREKDNWNYHGSFKYYSSETMYNKAGGEIHPGFCYYVGGNTKVYGAALFRLREKDFEKFRHKDGFSPEWPLKYRDFESYYDEAEDDPDISQPTHNAKAVHGNARAVLDILREEYVHQNEVWLSVLHGVQCAGSVLSREHVESFATKQHRQA